MLAELTNKFQTPVFFDHDGSVDDFIALITLLTLENCRLSGIAITNGNCNIDLATEASLRVLDLFCRHDVILAKSNATGINPFPIEKRELCEVINSLGILKGYSANTANISEDEAAEFTAKCILNEPEKTIVILTGPATNLSTAISKYPEIIEKIDKVLWLAGALLVDGNVNAPDHDGSAEWNIFWDPISASNLLNSGVPIFLFPLDACQQITIDNYVLFNLSENDNSKLSQLCYQLLTSADKKNQKKYFYDLLPVMYLKYPELFEFDNSSIKIEQRGTSLGNIYRSSLGSRIKYVKKVDDEMFCERFLEQVSQF